MLGDIVTNRRALRNYHILERFEAGLELEGTEVKSIRRGLANLQSAYARVENGEAIMHGVDIQPYDKASHEQHEARRPRRLLLHRREIQKLFEYIAIKGHSIVPLRMYWKKGRVKVELGVGRGKDVADKREDVKKRTVDREMLRTMRSFNQRKLR